MCVAVSGCFLSPSAHRSRSYYDIIYDDLFVRRRRSEHDGDRYLFDGLLIASTVVLLLYAVFFFFFFSPARGEFSLQHAVSTVRDCRLVVVLGL